MRNGQQYDGAHKFDYQRREVYVDGPSGKKFRLDGYIPRKEIVSRKFVQLARVKPKTALRYVREVPRKYGPGHFISKVPSSGPLAGDMLEGKMYLEVPVQNDPVPRAVIQEAEVRQVTIRDVTGREYH